MIKYILPLFILLTGCGNSYDENWVNPTVDIRALEFYNNFRDELHKRQIYYHDFRLSKTTIYFSSEENPLGESHGGFCNKGTSPDGRKFITITINEDIWNILPHGFKELLIFHELGHCVLNKPHSVNIMSAGLGYNIYLDYINNREEFIDELMEE